MSNAYKRLSLIFLLLSSLALAQGDSFEDARREFQRAYAAALAGTSAPPDTPVLQSYILYPYLQAARLRKALDVNAEASDADIEAFVQTNAAEPVSRELRRAWLMSLAQRAKWAQFLKYYRADASDIELRCQALSAQLSLQKVSELQSAVLAVWMSASRLPPNCSVPIAWARVQNVITPELVEQRVVLALKSGNAALARELLPSVPSARMEALSQWLQLLEQPQAAIDRLIANPGIVVDNAVLLDGWTRLARKDQDAALVRYAPWVASRNLDENAASPYALALALALSWSRRPEALTYFERAHTADFNEIAWEWYARAALWAGDWQRASNLIAAMPSTLQTQARWRYWAARAAEQLHDRATANAGYTKLVDTEDNYYAALAAARLNKKYTPHPQPLAVDRAVLDALEMRADLQRARELFFAGLKPQADGEWSSAYKMLTAGEQSGAIRLASRWGWHDLAIATAAQQRIFNDYALLYPRPYDEEVRTAAKLTKFSAELIYGQLRQESLYRPDVTSTANARGLLQLVPETARSTAKRWKLAVPKAEDLFEPAINVPLGAAHLRELADKYDGQMPIALAAYNAGPNAVARWLPQTSMEPDIWIENIPYNETRNYVQKVLWHSLVFRWLESGKSFDTREWLAKVHA